MQGTIDIHIGKNFRREEPYKNRVELKDKLQRINDLYAKDINKNNAIITVKPK